MKKIIFLILFVSSNVYSIDLSSPRATMKTYLMAMHNYKKGDNSAIHIAMETINLAHLDSAIKETSGKLIAEQLIQTLDRIEKINYAEIPINLKEKIWIYKKKSVHVGEKVYPVEISISLQKNGDKDKRKHKQIWKFTKNTSDTIGHFWNSLKKKKVVHGVVELKSKKDKIKRLMPAWTADRNFILLNGQWLGFIGILFLGWLFSVIIIFNLDRVIIGILAKDRVKIPKKVKNKVYKSLKWLIISLIWISGIRLLELHLEILNPLIRFGQIIGTISLVVLLYYFCDMVAAYFLKKAKESEDGFDDILVPLLQKTAKFLVIAIGFIFIGQSLALDMKGILAGLGIGGIAFAFAAKDALANFFGSITVLFDRPFHIGDWVVIDGTIEGQVESVGLRSTKIRTFYNSLTIVPNGTISNSSIDNYNQRKFRRFKTTVGVQYDTPPEKIEAFCEGIRELIITNKFARKDYFNVYLNEMSDSSLNILLHMFWEVPNYPTELAEKHRLLIDIIRLAKKMDVEFAFPTSTIHMYTEEKSTGVEVPKEEAPQIYGKNLAKKIAKKSISPKNPRSDIKGTQDFDESDLDSGD
ncbi:MAG: hypothetical protein DRQ88_00285 [Epsilonproteobacteria bacterium]|nr:MAG: hypothetical protein DRQ89_06210 [Campylobacterota bacterium]RLA68073.1 MAG: hypothetical protein DRQ88_00285 [Campylobacterota bacterium]